jgi:aminopeptidase
MTDPRITKLADLLVNYSVAVKPGDKTIIHGSTLSEPLLREIYIAALKAGGFPELEVELPDAKSLFYQYASDEQIQHVSGIDDLTTDTYDVFIHILSDVNTKALSGVDPQKQVLYERARTDLSKRFMARAADGSLRWTLSLFPTNAYAQDAEMSLTEYEDFVYNAIMPDMNDPVGYWKRFSARQQKVVEWLKGKENVHVTAPETDLRLSIKGRNFINCDCHENVPDGEVFCGPVEDSVEGYVKFSYPAIEGGREVSGIRLGFEKGKVVRASAEKNEDFLLKMLDTDEGSRYVGEFAIGTNEGIQKFTRQILFDEKIGGSFHMAVGLGYPESGSKNESAIHWDMICDMRQGGKIEVDGEVLYKDGKFVIDLD